MKDTQIHLKLITITRQDLSTGYQIVQSCHSVADFAYKFPNYFLSWRKNSNYKVCLSIKDESSLKKLFLKLKDINAPVIGFREPDLNNQLTSITLYGAKEYTKYTKYLPLAGKNICGVSSVVRASLSKSGNVGSNPTPRTLYNYNKNGNDKKIMNINLQ